MSRQRRTRIATLLVAAAVMIAAVAPAAAASAPRGSIQGSSAPRLELQRLLGGFDRPVYVAAHAGRHRLYVVEQSGRIRVLRRAAEGAPWENAGYFLDLRAKVAGPFIGRGLLGMAFHPEHARNGLFYVFYTRRHTDPAKHGDIEVAEYRRSTSLRADPSSARTVLIIDHPTQYHFGGWLGFGPDGYLYITTGDAAIRSLGHPQNIDSRLAKVLRLDPRPSGGRRHTVPADNPFVGRSGDDLVWAYGLRNPWRASFDRATGTFWLTDVGEARSEEINRFAPAATSRGANLGWSLCEGSWEYPPGDPPKPCLQPGMTTPTMEYLHGEGDCAIVGGYVYRGSAQPALAGRYVFADYCTGNLWSVPHDHPSGMGLPAPLTTGRQIMSFGEDADGELYVVTQGGGLWRLAAA